MSDILEEIRRCVSWHDDLEENWFYDCVRIGKTFELEVFITPKVREVSKDVRFFIASMQITDSFIIRRRSSWMLL